MPTALAILCCVLASISRMSCPEVSQKFSCRSLTAFRVPARSSRRLRSRARDILAPRYLTWLCVRVLLTRDCVELGELSLFLGCIALPRVIFLRVGTAIRYASFFCRTRVVGGMFLPAVIWISLRFSIASSGCSTITGRGTFLDEELIYTT